MEPDTAGDPITGLKWTRRTAGKISEELETIGIEICANTVMRLLKQLGYSFRVNHKKVSLGSPEERDRQFHYIHDQREFFAHESLPIISVDTKKKELIGNFRNPGSTLETTPKLVNDHDFRSHAEGIAVPYGILDLQENNGRMFLGLSHDTPAFAVDALVHWWTHEGHRTYPGADHLLILADGGGSNGSRIRAWKFELKHKFCDRFAISVSVCHYPPGASKWNPIEHRLFAQISQNWQGRPLDSTETILKYMRTTSTSTGLKVRASMTRRDYPTGIKITDAQMEELEVCWHEELPKWNYTLLPARAG